MPSELNKKPKRTKKNQVRLTTEEWLLLERKARKANLSKSEYIRRCAIGKKVKHRNPPKVNWRTYRELGELKRQITKLGTNINQIAVQINTAAIEGAAIPTNLPLPENLEQLQQLLKSLSQQISNAGLNVIGIDPTLEEKN